MKRKIIAILLTTTLLMTACDSSNESVVSGTMTEFSSEAVTETPEGSSSEAGNEADPDKEPISKTVDEVAEAVLAAYPDLEFNEIYSKDYSTDPNASLGVKALRLLNWGSSVPDDVRKYSHISVFIFEMYTESETYKSLVPGKMITFYLTDDISRDMTVLAINGQYVFAAQEVYLANEDDAYQTINEESPFHFEGIDKALKAFTDLK